MHNNSILSLRVPPLFLAISPLYLLTMAWNLLYSIRVTVVWNIPLTPAIVGHMHAATQASTVRLVATVSIDTECQAESARPQCHHTQNDAIKIDPPKIDANRSFFLGTHNIIPIPVLMTFSNRARVLTLLSPSCPDTNSASQDSCRASPIPQIRTWWNVTW